MYMSVQAESASLRVRRAVGLSEWTNATVITEKVMSEHFTCVQKCDRDTILKHSLRFQQIRQDGNPNPNPMYSLDQIN